MTDYITDEACGTNWTLLLGDSCERLAEIDANTVDLSICSPPFASLFTYSPSPRDLGNSASRGEFLEHYGFIIREQLRVTRPGRLACIHVQQLTTTKSTDGYMGMTDFRGQVIRAFQDGGWHFNGEVTVWKDPQAQSIRTRSHALAFATKNRDSAGSRPALADYLLLFRKPGDNAVPIKTDVTNDEWIEWAAPIWTDHHDGGWLTTGGHICPWAGHADAAPDPYFPIPPVWCPGGGTQTSWGGWCDGRSYPDGTKWHMDSYWAPFVGRVWNPIVCVVADAPAPPPLAGPGGCGGAV